MVVNASQADASGVDGLFRLRLAVGKEGVSIGLRRSSWGHMSTSHE